MVARREAGKDLRASVGRGRLAALVLAAKPHCPIACTIGGTVRRCFSSSGGLSEEKGIGTLLEAFSGIRQRILDATLRIVGTGPMGDVLRHEVEEAGLGASVHSRQPAGRAALARILRRNVHGAAERARRRGARHERGALPRVSGDRSESCGCVPNSSSTASRAMRSPRATSRACSARC